GKQTEQPSNHPVAVTENAIVSIKLSFGAEQRSGSGFLVHVDGDTGYIVASVDVVTPEAKGKGPLKLAANFRSGPRKEQVVDAQVIVKEDLAVLKVAGVKEFPQPVNFREKVEPAPGMIVHAFGFAPALVPNPRDPAIVAGKGRVSNSLRGSREDIGIF